VIPALPIHVGKDVYRESCFSIHVDALSAGGFVEKRKVGRTNYYINLALHPILTGSAMGGGDA
jgi:hypothetical protein